MNTFDAWETGIHSNPDVLMHWGVRGMKHGRRRYQNEDGTWTEEGLAARRKREGFGEDRQVRKLEKKVAKAEKKQAKKAARAEKKFEKAEKKRKSKLSGLTDEEMKAKLERAKMEAEYQDITKRHSLIDSGAKVISSYLDYKKGKEERALESNRQKLEMKKLETQQIQAKEQTKQSLNKAEATKAEATKAKMDFKKMKQDRKAGLAKERKSKLIDKKMEYKNYTVRGGIGKRINQFLSAGKAKQYEAIRKAKGDVKADKKRYIGNANKKLYESEADRALKLRQQDQSFRDSYNKKKETIKWRKKKSKLK